VFFGCRCVFVCSKNLLSVAVLQIELAKVKGQKIPSGWAADSSGKVSIRFRFLTLQFACSCQ